MSLLLDFHIFSDSFNLLPEKEQKFIILASQETLWNTGKENIQKVVLKTWEHELYQTKMIDYTRKNKMFVEVCKGKNYHLILSGVENSTEHSDFQCGCELLYNNLIQQFILVEPHNECQAHKRTQRKVKSL